MFQPLTKKELKKFRKQIQKMTPLVGISNIEIYGSSPEDEIGAVVVFDTTDGDRSAVVFGPQIARRLDYWEIMVYMKQAIDDTRASYQRDPQLSEINPQNVDFSKLKSYSLRWLPRPTVLSGFQTTADSIPIETWETMFHSLKNPLRQKLSQYIDSQPVIDFQKILQIPGLVVNTYLDDIKFAAVARIDHFRVMRGEELVLFLSMVCSTREKVAEEIEQMRAAGVPPIILPESDTSSGV